VTRIARLTAPGTARVAARVTIAGLAIVALAACGAEDTAAPATAPAGGTAASAAGDEQGEVEGEIIVSAAASLTESFDVIGADFEAANPGVDVTFTYGPSSGLATQIVEGAPADVAAFANEATMQTLVDAAAVDGDPRVFATNVLVVVTKPGNPEGVRGVEDLTDVGVVALCGADVPCGTFSQEVLDKAGVTIPETSVTRGEDVRATLAAVSEGDAVAAIVYETDAAVVGDAVETVAIPDDLNVVATYPIAALSDSGSPDAAAAFVEYVLSPGAQEVLADAGFGPPVP
jgi:molybdate transport system substrate-binding protein